MTFIIRTGLESMAIRLNLNTQFKTILVNFHKKHVFYKIYFLLENKKLTTPNIPSMSSIPRFEHSLMTTYKGRTKNYEYNIRCCKHDHLTILLYYNFISLLLPYQSFNLIIQIYHYLPTYFYVYKLSIFLCLRHGLKFYNLK